MEHDNRLPFPYEYTDLKPEELKEVTKWLKYNGGERHSIQFVVEPKCDSEYGFMLDVELKSSSTSSFSSSTVTIGYVSELHNSTRRQRPPNEIAPAIEYMRVGPKGYIVSRTYPKDAENIYNMPLRPDDIFVTCYQRSGTTWTQELVWLVANNLDYAQAAAIPIAKRSTFLEFFMFFNEKWKIKFAKSVENKGNKEESLEIIEALCNPVTEALEAAKSPRFIKSHLPLSLLPPRLLDTARVVYVARDPRDVAVSYYHQSKLFEPLYEFVGSFKDYWNLFKNDLILLTPYFPHVKEAWEKRHHPNMLFLFYEELSKDLPAAVRRVAKFLGKELTTEELDRLCDHLNIENFRKNKSVNYEDLKEYGLTSSEETFIRKGKAGGWRDYFDSEMSLEAERWIEQNLRDTDLRFPNM